MTDAEPLSQASSYFDRTAAYWRDVYDEQNVQGLVYRERFATVLDWADRLLGSAGGRILEIGPGAGRLTVELARRGHHVTSIDASPGMLELTEQHAADAGVRDRVTVSVGDVHRLGFDDASFDLVIAVGVIPWLDEPGQGVREMARVLVPGGHLLLTADNRWRMNALVEPRLSPLLSPIKLLRRALRRRRGGQPESGQPESAVSRMHSRAGVQRLLEAARVQSVQHDTLGFGPFTFLDRWLLPNRVALGVHGRLQSLALRNVPGVRSMGWHHVVVARKPG
jgi:ubiquinone/menaquinone biosynthesis C-methylase UbiE